VPITCSAQITPLDQEAFHDLDKKVMKHAFAVHNELGRFFDEDVYQTELVQRCVADGLDVKREVMVCVEFKTFKKSLRVIQWVNFNRNQISLRTICSGSE
jgi:hypothetical protein